MGVKDGGGEWGEALDIMGLKAAGSSVRLGSSGLGPGVLGTKGPVTSLYCAYHLSVTPRNKEAASWLTWCWSWQRWGVKGGTHGLGS